MIRITIVKDKQGTYREITSFGHAGYAAFGKDIVCAAVSALLMNTVNAVETFTEDAFTQEADEAGGRLQISFPGGVSRETTLLLDTLCLGLKDLQKQYGSYLSLVIATEEVT